MSANQKQFVGFGFGRRIKDHRTFCRNNRISVTVSLASLQSLRNKILHMVLQVQCILNFLEEFPPNEQTKEIQEFKIDSDF